MKNDQERNGIFGLTKAIMTQTYYELCLSRWKFQNGILYTKN